MPGTLLAALSATPDANEGPFYPVRLPKDSDADLLRVDGAVRRAGGEVLHLAGRVLESNGRAVAGARVEIWQCESKGIYLHPGDGRNASRDTGFQGFGHALADRAGRFKFRTIAPVPYPGRTPHIHVKVLDGWRDLLTTQLYRAGHPQNESDFLFRRMTEPEQRRVSMRLRTRGGEFETDIDLVVGG